MRGQSEAAVLNRKLQWASLRKEHLSRLEVEEEVGIKLVGQTVFQA